LNLAGADEVVTAIALYGVDLKGGFARWVGALGWCVGLVRWVGALGWRVGLDVPGSIGLDVGSVGCIRDPWQFSSTLQHLSNNFNQVLNTIPQPHSGDFGPQRPWRISQIHLQSGWAVADREL
jgi:hypothetical protein